MFGTSQLIFIWIGISFIFKSNFIICRGNIIINCDDIIIFRGKFLYDVVHVIISLLPIRFATDWPQKYIGLINLKDGEAKQFHCLLLVIAKLLILVEEIFVQKCWFWNVNYIKGALFCFYNVYLRCLLTCPFYTCITLFSQFFLSFSF